MSTRPVRSKTAKLQSAVFQTFDRGTRAAVLAAMGEARARGDTYVGTEHLLLGLLCIPSRPVGLLLDAGLDLGRARQLLTDLDTDALAAVGVDIGLLDPSALEADLPGPDQLDGPGRRRSARRARRRRLPFTSGAKGALHRCVDEARTMGDRRLTVEHLALSLTASPPPDVAVDVLHRAGVDPVELRRRLTAPNQ